jgi:hypothetical protein
MVALRMKMLPSGAKPLAENAVLLTGRTRLRYCGILLLPPMVTKISPSGGHPGRALL